MSIFQRINTPPATEVEKEKAIEEFAKSPETAGTLPLIATTMHGLEEVLAAELAALGATDINPSKRAVEFRGDERVMYRACYELRTAIRVLVRIHSCKIYNEKNLYHALRDEIDWTERMAVTDTLAINSVVAGPLFRNSLYANQLAKDAIVDQFRDKFGRRPNVDNNSPRLRVHIRVNGNYCDVLLDASGDSLHKRGYRRDAVLAPLNEVLAAGMIQMTDWRGQSPFVDGMCGSGTLPIEAAMVSMNIPAQMFREIPFGFTHWKNFDTQVWRDIKQEANAKMLSKPEHPIFASDKDSKARSATSINAMSAGLDKIIQIDRSLFEKLEPPTEIGGVLMLNPPYDERLPVDEVTEFYQSIANRLKHHWPGWTAWILSGNRDALKHFGLRPSRRIELINGSIECDLKKFDLFAGKKGHNKVVSETPEVPENTDTDKTEIP
jgi:putative N6-adenine-specific DNA methylase